MSREPKRVGRGTAVAIGLIILLMIAASGFFIWLCIDMVNQPMASAPTENQTVTLPTQATLPQTEPTQPPTTQPEPERVIATATVASMGDLLMHKPVFDTCLTSNGYDFSYLFQYVKDLVSGYDYAVANLETTFGGDDYVYQGNPAFNCPDPLIDAVKDAGYDMLLTANNHAGDTQGPGILRTIEVVRGKGIATLGSQLENEPRYSIVDVNGIRIGMVCYTWAYSGDGSQFSLNGMPAVKDVGQMNYFHNSNPDKLYNEVTPMMEEMKEQGADVTMMFIHWGQEYQTQENDAQRKMAQKLCDIGFDVIVGGHPHVVQPVSLLESTQDPTHKTVCIYSLGNFVSNQRTGISTQFPVGYTEDGAVFTVSFEKYSDGKVYVSGADVIPTWVNMHSNEGSRRYDILPLQDENRDQWQSMFKMTDGNTQAAERSYSRTMDIVEAGLNTCQEWIAQSKADREAYYNDLAYHPEKYAAAETVPETTPEPTPETILETTPETTLSPAA